MDKTNIDEGGVVQLDLTTLLGFDQIADADVDAATLLDELDSVHNKIGETGTEVPPPP